MNSSRHNVQIPPAPRIIHLLKTRELKCPICRKKFTEHSEAQEKICKIILIKEFANNCPGYDAQFDPYFE